jgi:hypothetical protein
MTFPGAKILGFWSKILGARTKISKISADCQNGRLPKWQVPEWQVPKWQVPEWQVPKWQVPKWQPAKMTAPKRQAQDAVYGPIGGKGIGGAWKAKARRIAR